MYFNNFAMFKLNPFYHLQKWSETCSHKCETSRPGKHWQSGKLLAWKFCDLGEKIKKYIRETLPHWREIYPAGGKFGTACREIYIFSSSSRQIVKFHFQVITRFILFRLWNDILYIYMVAALFGVKNLLFSWEIPPDFWNVQWAISPLVPWRFVAYFVRTSLKYYWS